MLDLPDTEIVKAWLKQAFARASPPVGPSDLAKHCGVTKQAVNGWITTGRIRKGNLTRAVEFFGHGPAFGHREPHLAESANQAIALSVREPEPLYGWPFKRVSAAALARLPDRELEKIETHALFVIEQWTQAGHEDARAPAATRAAKR